MLDGTAKLPVEALLKPCSIALVGASSRGGGSGAKILESARTFGFAGPIWPIHPTASEIAGLPCFPSLEALPEPPDCVVIAVPAEAVLRVLADAGAAGIRSALVVSEGFADAATDEGRRRQDELIGVARAANMAVAGPNCMGVASLRYKYAATMADIPASTPAGGISVVSQSGGMLNAVAEFSNNRGFGLNYLISIGNQAVLDLADYIDFLVDDEATSVVALIMEGAKNGRRFRSAIERAARRKPIVVLKLGRSPSGQAATFAHTGTLAGRHQAYAALFRQNGVALVDSIDQLLETAALFSQAPLPKGGRVAMFTVSGGATSLVGDIGEAAAIEFPPISAATNRRLENILDVERSFGNPIDTVGMPRLRRADNMANVVAALQDDDGIDIIGLVLGMRMQGAEAHDALVEVMAKAAATATKPLVVVSFIGNSLTGRWRGFAAERGLPILDNLESGMRAIRQLVDYAKFRQREARSRTGARDIDLPALAPGLTLTEAVSKRILATAGLPVTKETLVRTPQEAVRAWRDIGGAVALKIQSPDIPHKSDVGGVHLGAATAEEVEKAATQVLARSVAACPDARIDGVLVEEMVDGVEFLLGMTYDDQLGPLFVLGAGGVTVEIFKDSAVRLPPIDATDVREMLEELKVVKLLHGFRGAPERDIEALVECCVRFAQFVAATDGQFAAIDLNPVFVREKGKGVCIADALMITRGLAEDRR
jgi:acyl-CoA synthetase (NDP forming)